MEIHKPKPWHGWPEFAKEVGTIVLGVLIAIAAEQAVEALHHRDVVRHGEEALSDNFARFVEYKAALDQEAPCMAARVAELRAIIDEAAIKRPAAHRPHPAAVSAPVADRHLGRDGFVSGGCLPA